MNSGDLLIHWTARLVVIVYLLRLTHDLGLIRIRRISDEKQRFYWELLWTCGGLIYLFHVLAAFGWEHNWSHLRAYEHTAAQTEKVTGWNWGGGIWINYGFGLIWAADVLYQIRTPPNQRPQSYSLYLHSFFSFIIFNATVVFGPPFWIAVAIGYLLLIYVLKRNKRTQSV